MTISKIRLGALGNKLSHKYKIASVEIGLITDKLEEFGCAKLNAFVKDFYDNILIKVDDDSTDDLFYEIIKLFLVNYKNLEDNILKDKSFEFKDIYHKIDHLEFVIGDILTDPYNYDIEVPIDQVSKDVKRFKECIKYEVDSLVGFFD